MDNRRDVHDFLAGRRARLTPEQAGLPTYGGVPTVKGLRREEVALIAGVSVDYYNRLERGHLGGVSDSVLEALASALQLTEAERIHLSTWPAGAAHSTRGTRRRASTAIRPSIRRVLDGMTGVPAYVRNTRMDILDANSLCRALYAGALNPTTMPLNLARFVFLDTRSTALFLDWEVIADDLVGSLRVEAGRSPLDRSLTDLVGELVTRSENFRVRWAKHNVRQHRTVRKRLHNPVVGDVELTGDALELPGDGLTIITYTAPPGSPDQDKLELLASWSTTPQPTAPTALQDVAGD